MHCKNCGSTNMKEKELKKWNDSTTRYTKVGIYCGDCNVEDHTETRQETINYPKDPKSDKWW